MKAVHEEARSMFLLLDDDGQRMGYITYEKTEENAVRATHTKVYPAFEGKGYARLLLDTMAEWAKEKGIKIIPACPYVARAFEKHPEKYAAVAAE